MDPLVDITLNYCSVESKTGGLEVVRSEVVSENQGSLCSASVFGHLYYRPIFLFIMRYLLTKNRNSRTVHDKEFDFDSAQRWMIAILIKSSPL